MNMFNRIAILIALSSIVGSTYPNIAVASSNEQICETVAMQKLEETDFGSEEANDARWIIVPVAHSTVMDIIKRSNRGELNSFEDRQNEIKERLKQKNFIDLDIDYSEVSYQAADIIEPLLEDECQGVT